MKVGGRRARRIVGPITGAMARDCNYLHRSHSDSGGSAYLSPLVATLRSRLLLDVDQNGAHAGHAILKR